MWRRGRRLSIGVVAFALTGVGAVACDKPKESKPPEAKEAAAPADDAGDSEADAEYEARKAAAIRELEGMPGGD